MVVFLNGHFYEKEKVGITPFNSGFLFGKGLFETLRTFNKKPILLDKHISRLNKSLKFFGFKEIKLNLVENVIGELLQINNLSSARIRITINKNLISCDDNLLIDIDEYKPTFKENIHIMIYSEKVAHGCLIRMHKTTNYFFNEFVFEEAQTSGYDEALLIDHMNHIVEGTRTNIFLVKDGIVYTPSLECGILPGITRQFVIENAFKAGIEVKEKIVTYNEILEADEVFLTNSLNGIIKVKKVNDKDITNFNISEKFRMIYNEKLFN